MIVGLSLSHGSGIPEVEQEKQRQIVSSRDDNGLEKSGMLWWDNLVSVDTLSRYDIAFRRPSS